MDGAQQANKGEMVKFFVALDPPIANPVFSWSVSAGVITSGQGTPVITVDTANVVGPLTATVNIPPDRVPPGCRTEMSFTTTIIDPQFGAKPGGSTEDDFTEIPQIGPARATTLQGAGIRSFKDLANTPVERLKELFPAITEELLNEWLQGAKKRAS